MLEEIGYNEEDVSEDLRATPVSIVIRVGIKRSCQERPLTARSASPAAYPVIAVWIVKRDRARPWPDSSRFSGCVKIRYSCSTQNRAMKLIPLLDSQSPVSRHILPCADAR